jgi:hypothetical protein
VLHIKNFGWKVNIYFVGMKLTLKSVPQIERNGVREKVMSFCWRKYVAITDICTAKCISNNSKYPYHHVHALCTPHITVFICLYKVFFIGV